MIAITSCLSAARIQMSSPSRLPWPAGLLRGPSSPPSLMGLALSKPPLPALASPMNLMKESEVRRLSRRLLCHWPPVSGQMLGRGGTCHCSHLSAQPTTVWLADVTAAVTVPACRLHWQRAAPGVLGVTTRLLGASVVTPWVQQAWQREYPCSPLYQPSLPPLAPACQAAAYPPAPPTPPAPWPPPPRLSTLVVRGDAASCVVMAV